MLIVDALFRHAFGTVLAHAESVTEAASLDDEGVWGLCFGVGFGVGGLGDDGDFGAAEIEGVAKIFCGDPFAIVAADKFELAIAASGGGVAYGINGSNGTQANQVAEFIPADDFVPTIDGCVLVVVGDRAQIGDSAPPNILDVFGMAATGGMEEGFDNRAIVGEDLSSGGIDGGLGSGGFVLDTPINLTTGGVAKVETAIPIPVTTIEGVGSGGDGLGFEGFLGPVAVHFSA